ncbi:hypothetical protein ACIQU4_12805 [Streptomyces sp. NPDC090741]|uniref:hypothetical protein n=1 Tax=Streptomyces sp. NPDC090741 TaxID=3365967 RepID=UPI00382373B1
MGIKDQFQDKARDLKDKADKADEAGRSAKDEASKRGAHASEPAKKKDKVHDELDDNWDF